MRDADEGDAEAAGGVGGVEGVRGVVEVEVEGDVFVVVGLGGEGGGGWVG